MIDLKYTAELESFMKNLPINDKWQLFNSERKNAIAERAFFDTAAYAASLAAEFDLENDFCRRALFEQTAHIVSCCDNDSGGRTVLQETVTGFGSRKYKDPDTDLLSPRAKSYLDQLKPNIRILH